MNHELFPLALSQTNVYVLVYSACYVYNDVLVYDVCDTKIVTFPSHYYA